MALQYEVDQMSRRVALEMSSMKHFSNRSGVVNGCIIALQQNYGFMSDVEFTTKQQAEIVDETIRILEVAQADPEIRWA